MIKIDHIGMQKQRFSHRLYVALFLCGSKKMNTFVLARAEDNIIRVDIPPIPRNRLNFKIEFNLPDAISPKELKMSEDSRKLAIGIISATFVQ